MAKLYLWTETPVYYTGHISLETDNSYISFHPQSGKIKYINHSVGRFSSLREDLVEYNSEYKNIVIDNKLMDKFIDDIYRNIKNKQNTYELFETNGKNCSGFVATILISAYKTAYPDKKTAKWIDNKLKFHGFTWHGDSLVENDPMKIFDLLLIGSFAADVNSLLNKPKPKAEQDNEEISNQHSNTEILFGKIVNTFVLRQAIKKILIKFPIYKTRVDGWTPYEVYLLAYDIKNREDSKNRKGLFELLSQNKERYFNEITWHNFIDDRHISNAARFFLVIAVAWFGYLAVSDQHYADNFIMSTIGLILAVVVVTAILTFLYKTILFLIFVILPRTIIISINIAIALLVLVVVGVITASVLFLDGKFDLISKFNTVFEQTKQVSTAQVTNKHIPKVENHIQAIKPQPITHKAEAKPQTIQKSPSQVNPIAIAKPDPVTTEIALANDRKTATDALINACYGDSQCICTATNIAKILSNEEVDYYNKNHKYGVETGDKIARLSDSWHCYQ